MKRLVPLFRSAAVAAAAFVATTVPQAAHAADYETWLSAGNAVRWQSDQPWKVNLGIGAGLAPRFEYSRDNDVTLLPLIDVEWRDFLFASTQRGVGANLINNGRVTAGARVTYDFGREPGDDEFLEETEPVAATPQVGVFWISYSGPWRFSADVKYATSSYKGLEGMVGIAHGGNLNDNTNVIAGIDVHFATKKYNAAYFDDAATGLNDFTPFLTVVHHLSQGMYVSLDGRISFVTGPAAKSDITGSRSYFAGALFGKRF